MTSAPFPSATGTALRFARRFVGLGAFTTTSTSFTTVFLAATHQSFVKRHERASLPSRTRLRKPDDLVRHLRRQFPLRVDLRVRALIEQLALLLQESHARQRVLSH